MGDVLRFFLQGARLCVRDRAVVHSRRQEDRRRFHHGGHGEHGGASWCLTAKPQLSMIQGLRLRRETNVSSSVFSVSSVVNLPCFEGKLASDWVWIGFARGSER